MAPPPRGAPLLAAGETFIRRYCALPSKAAQGAVTLWAPPAHAIGAARPLARGQRPAPLHAPRCNVSLRQSFTYYVGSAQNASGL
jgi:hypothetical protein